MLVSKYHHKDRRLVWKWILAAALLAMAGVGCEQSTGPSAAGGRNQPPRDDRQVVRDFTHLYIESDDDLPFTARFLGMRVMQNPADMWTIQEIIADVRPDLLIETGTAEGGTALYYATLLRAVNPQAAVITIDIEPRVEEAIAQIGSTELRERVGRIFDESIDVIESDSLNPDLVRRLAERTRGKKVLVILDSCHHSRHVLKELEIYSQFVSPDSYIIAQDTVIDREKKWIDAYAQCSGYGSEAGPGKAVTDFLRDHGEFEADASRERYLLTFCPGGFLKRK